MDATDRHKENYASRFQSNLPVSSFRQYLPADVLKLLAKSFNDSQRNEFSSVTGIIYSEARHGSGSVYFDFGHENGLIQAKIPLSQLELVRQGYEVVVSGTLTATHNPLWNSGVTPTIQGEIVDRRIPRSQLSLNINRSLPKLSLLEFIFIFPKSYMILGTNRAIEDLNSEVIRNGFKEKIPSMVVRMSSKLDLLVAFQNLPNYVKGVILIRGGSDSSNGMQIWNDRSLIEEILSHEIHIYLGIGHFDTKTALDQYADQVFATPTAAGNALSSAILTTREIKKQDEEKRQGRLRRKQRIRKLKKYLKYSFIVCVILILVMPFILSALEKSKKSKDSLMDQKRQMKEGEEVLRPQRKQTNQEIKKAKRSF